MGDTLLSIAMLGGFALLGGAVMVFRHGDRRRALLMVVAALVLFANVAIWILPDASGKAPLTQTVQPE